MTKVTTSSRMAGVCFMCFMAWKIWFYLFTWACRLGSRLVTVKKEFKQSDLPEEKIARKRIE